ncbi:hypothetical protein QFX18_19090 [Saccharophagus degradans]|uniref:hypothetical protein n=1 Tax=Saccharophagus degradans TaxID=86304 RepID=UPI002477D630|nr:hypothetical protein [Saccharophagus degradans]WGO98115.1 hypothetical protein QFX18_19090 [Saccharophagus degradans]
MFCGCRLRYHKTITSTAAPVGGVMRQSDMKIDISIYNEILEEILKSVESFEGVSKADTEEVKEDFESVIEDVDINLHSSSYTGGKVKTTSDLLDELRSANTHLDKQKCIESIAMLRSSIMTIETAFSNAADSMEKIVVSIRDA